MSLLKKTIICLVFFLIPHLSFSTHIVGGVLNYTYNGGNVYSITLKLYRDCGTSAAGFPGSVTIKVKGNNGANFSPSKDITISLGNVTTLSANLAPCAVAPNPMPCVQEGIYTKTVTLPPNNGGYHLYYQVSARNLSLTNINGACNCIGESFYAYIPNNSVASNSNSNAVFTNFPPLFICANEAFTFNHSATDANGDSLVYSLYTPYEDNTAPTYSNNVAIFPQVVYLPGYTTNNPLGATPFYLNPVTGVLTGTPNTIGQFVVGVKVKEYRNGVYISQTLRDFQFNVLNCPAPPPTLAISNMTLNNGCSVKVNATGITAASSSWKSIYPGAQGAYNNFISCTSNCLNPTITAIGNPPPYIDFVVCGIATNCLGNNVCDTFRVHFNPPLSVSITPGNPALCNGQTSTTLSAIGSGGTPPYNFLWNNVNPTQTISVGAGTYNIKLTDGSGCPPAYSSAVVTSYSVPVAVNAGADKTVCITNPVTALNATVTGATGGIWSAGNGTFSPNNNTTSNLFYTPTAAELATGSATLVLTSTGSGACPAATDTVVISYSNFTGSVSTSTNAVSCYGGSNGSATLSITGGMNPHTYVWNSVPSQTTAHAANLQIGTYSVTVTNAIGCQMEKTVSISQPLPIALNSTLSNVSCFSGSNGSISVSALGGTSPYNYTFVPGNIINNSLTNISAGTYSVITKDSKNCSLTSTFSITQPTSLTATFTQTNISCYNGNDGKINSVINGGTSPYTYSWNPGGASAPSLTGLTAGTYTLILKDNLNCTLVKTITLSQPTQLIASVSSTNESCNYLDNGSVKVIASGGTSSYIYLWQPGSFTTSAINNLSSGNYSVNVTDTKGCSTSTEVVVSEPTPLTINFNTPLHVSCFGGSSGSVTANVSGGNGSYTYSWTASSITTASITNLSSGIYTLSVTDTKSCITSNTISITEPSALSISAASTSVSCYGGNNGTASITVAGGTSPYAYFWLPSGQTTSSIGGLTSGTYTSLITDAKGCTISISPFIPQASSISIGFTSTNVSCYNGTNGSISSSIAGGTGPYNLNWYPGNIATHTISGLPMGTYTLQITDAQSCGVSKTVSISQPQQLAITCTITNETCDYSNNGSASVTASGGSPAYNFIWQPGALTGANISNLSSGNYSLTTTDNNGCTTTTVLTISEPATLVGSITAVNHVSCFGGSNGAASVIGSGGTPNYSYTWTPGNTHLSNVSNLSIGLYTLTISDSKLCSSQITLNITQPTSLTASGNVSTVSCYGGSNGSIQLTPSGGTSPYTYLWIPVGQTTSSLTNLSIGSYSVSIFDANGCQLNANYSVTQSSSISIAFTATQVSCFNGSNGRINSIVNGGNAPYTYNWSYGSMNTADITGLPAGSYTLTVTDNFNCTASKTVSISQPIALALSTTVSAETCDYLNNGSANALAYGGTPGYSYLWMPGANTTSNVSNLSSGNYTIMVTDFLGCTTNSIVSITEPAPLTVTFSSVVDVSCNGGNDGSATALGVGGTANYSYTWSAGPTINSMLSNVAIGTYSVFITDAQGCQAQKTVSISEPTPLTLVPSISNVVCTGGSNGAISISMNGGVAPYNHVLMPGNIIGANFSNLLPGTYSIITTDAHNCVNNTTIAINQPINISTSTSFTNADCSTQNGVASISVTSGGTPPFAYNWLPTGGTSSLSTNLFAGSYTVEVTDGLGCVSTKIVNITDNNAPIVGIASTTSVSCYGGTNGALTATYTGGTGACTYSWSPYGGTGLTASGLSAGVYVIQVTDNAGCIGLTTSSMIAEPTPVVVSVIPQNVSCFGGNDGGGSANISGGTPGYTYVWSNGVNTPSVTGLTANTYTLQITDGNNCIQSNTFSVSQPSAPLSLSSIPFSVSCFGGSTGSVTSSATGGTAPYNFNLQPGNFNGQTISNLPAGTYTITSNDFKSCVTATTVIITEPALITLVPGSVNSNCAAANGQISVAASGGIGSYSYQWAPAGGTNSIAAGLFSGNYSVTVTDANNCAATTTLTLIDNPQPTVSVNSTTNVSCYGGNNGAAFVSVNGGTGPFTYAWMPSGGNTNTGSNLVAGSYSVTVTSANGCTVVAASPIISEPDPLYTIITPTAVSCFGGNNGAASANTYGGTAGYSYTWQSSAINTSNVSNLSSGNYTVTTTDANNCTLTKSFTITQPTAPLTVTLSSTSVLCFGGSTGSASVIASGGTSPYDFNWSLGNINGQNASNLIAGIYTLTATDLHACSTNNTVQVTEPSAFQLSISSINSNCSLANGQLSATVSGGTNSYTYTWSPLGGSTAIAPNLSAGNYTLTVSDSNNCFVSQSSTVVDNPSPLVSIANVTNVTCYTGTNGSATADVFGGTGPFTFTWIPTGGNGFTANGLTAGSYSIIVQSANGCTAISTASVVSEPTQILTNIITSSVSCFGGTNGSALLQSGGGTPGYTYILPSGTSTNSFITGLGAGNYSLTVTDLQNCVQSVSFSIAEPASSVSVSILSFSNVSCFNGSNGNIIAQGTGGTAPYNYNWNPIAGNTATLTGLSSGTYSSIITDNNGCTNFTTHVITQPLQPLTASSIVDNVSCFGGSNGSATVNPTGGTAGYTFSWFPSGSSSQSPGGLSFGNYSVTISDINNCNTTISVFINQPSPLSGTLVSVNASCDMANGSIIAQVEGGTGPYTYIWQPNLLTTSSINSLSPGSYSLQITDAASCFSELSATLINIAGPTVNIPNRKNVTCFGGNNGSATLTINQGTSPFNVSWQPYGGSTTIGSSLMAGSYTAVVTDGLGCIATHSTSISEPNILNVSITSVKKVSCFGGSNGSISVIADGGTPSYTYAWVGNQINNTITGLSAGTYTLNLRDANNCTLSVSANVPQPTALTSSVLGVNNALCYSGMGSASVSASGGEAPYSFLWNSSPIQMGNILSNVVSSNYTVRIVDANGCTTNNSVTITQPTQVTTSVLKTDTLCFGDRGILTATAQGGKGNYYYTWSPGAITNSGTFTYNATSNVTYTVLAFDENGCSGNDAKSAITVYNLTPANTHIDGLDLVCPGKSSVLEAIVSGIQGPLKYTWNNNLPPISGLHVVTPSQATTYIVTISNSCGRMVKDSIEVKINDLPIVDLTSDTLNTCTPGIINFTDKSKPINSADPLISWTWDFGDGVYSGEQNPAHLFTKAGTYTVNLEVTSDRGCSNKNFTSPLIITAYPKPQAAFSLNSDSLDLPYDVLICTNQTTGAVNYSWSFGNDGSSNLTSPEFLMQSLGDQSIQLIAISEYGCSDTTYKYINTNADIIFPTAFTPSEEGSSSGTYQISSLTNDVFFPYTSGVVEYNLQVFNRWGELIFESKDVNYGWDGYYRGKLCQVGVYVWKANIVLNNGKTFRKAGNISLLR